MIHIIAGLLPRKITSSHLIHSSSFTLSSSLLPHNGRHLIHCLCTNLLRILSAFQWNKRVGFELLFLLSHISTGLLGLVGRSEFFRALLILLLLFAPLDISAVSVFDGGLKLAHSHSFSTTSIIAIVVLIISISISTFRVGTITVTVTVPIDLSVKFSICHGVHHVHEFLGLGCISTHTRLSSSSTHDLTHGSTAAHEISLQLFVHVSKCEFSLAHFFHEFFLLIIILDFLHFLEEPANIPISQEFGNK
mmetsp:Transcript_14648/g.21871  ORF Transcript_14648/g.21871 Transcript_14648/m.21871 type:complete len:249 (-) Transcript_14648:1017-1763(-)